MLASATQSETPRASAGYAGCTWSVYKPRQLDRVKGKVADRSRQPTEEHYEQHLARKACLCRADSASVSISVLCLYIVLQNVDKALSWTGQFCPSRRNKDSPFSDLAPARAVSCVKVTGDLLLGVSLADVRDSTALGACTGRSASGQTGHSLARCALLPHWQLQ